DGVLKTFVVCEQGVLRWVSGLQRQAASPTRLPSTMTRPWCAGLQEMRSWDRRRCLEQPERATETPGLFRQQKTNMGARGMVGRLLGWRLRHFKIDDGDTAFTRGNERSDHASTCPPLAFRLPEEGGDFLDGCHRDAESHHCRFDWIESSCCAMGAAGLWKRRREPEHRAFLPCCGRLGALRHARSGGRSSVAPRSLLVHSSFAGSANYRDGVPGWEIGDGNSDCCMGGCLPSRTPGQRFFQRLGEPTSRARFEALWRDFPVGPASRGNRAPSVSRLARRRRRGRCCPASNTWPKLNRKPRVPLPFTRRRG